MAVDRWTREQLIVAFALYCQTPFGKMHRTNPEIVRTAKILGRTPSSLAMKLVNFASLDPAIIKTGRKGLGNASMEDKKVWDAFHADWEQLALQSAKIGSERAPNESYSPDEFAISCVTTGEQCRIAMSEDKVVLKNQDDVPIKNPIDLEKINLTGRFWLN